VYRQLRAVHEIASACSEYGHRVGRFISYLSHAKVRRMTKGIADWPKTPKDEPKHVN
jgi:hypothetical protein